MAIPHAEAGEVVDVGALDAALLTTRSHAIFKSADLEVMRIVMLAGDQMRPHAVAGEITLQCIEGRVAFSCNAGQRELVAGQLVRMTGEEVHALRGIEDSSLLLTIALHASADGRAMLPSEEPS